MNRQLTSPPLVYMLAQVKISPILELESYIPKIQESIRENFPLYKLIDIQRGFVVTPQGEIAEKKITRWHFADKSSTTGIIADTDAITFHTTQYDSFERLIKQFRVILEKFKKELKISLYTRIGLRYFNVIPLDPRKEYLKKELLGFHLNEASGFKNKFITRTETIQETTLGLIKIKASNFSDRDFIQCLDIKELLINYELREGIEYLSFDLKKQKGGYSTLDIDHFVESGEEKDDFEVTKIIEKLKQLHNGITEVFKNAITDDASTEWK